MTGLKVIMPSKALLKKIGIRIRKRRLDLHMTQAELAKGLCTQSTISALENDGCFNQWSIIPKIVLRLGMNLDEMCVSNNYCYAKELLKQIECNLLHYHFEKANTIIKTIKVENIDSKEIKGRYYCERGFAELFCGVSLDEVTLCFHTMIDTYAVKANIVCTAWSYLGMAISYRRLGCQKLAHKYLDDALMRMHHLLHQKQTNLDERYIIIKLGLAIVTFAFISNNYQLVINESNRMIAYLKRKYSFYCLKSFYSLKYLSYKQEKLCSKAKAIQNKINLLNGVRDSGRIDKLLKIAKQKSIR